MEESHKLGLYVSYYLSRFNEVAYKNLGYGNMLQTHNEIGHILSVPPNTVKNWRDEFDPLFGHRAGWYQRPMSQSRIRVVEALEDLDEISVRAIVIDILNGKAQTKEYETEQLVQIVSDKEPDFETGKFILRGPTGKSAEEYFINLFNENNTPFSGKLIDCRDYGCGYDFKIEGSKLIYIEVKGLATEKGGILFTNKEWQKANDTGDNYFVCLVKNIDKIPEVIYINNPAKKFNPQKSIHTVIQLNWSVSEKNLQEIL
jgi:hypothetical protein